MFIPVVTSDEMHRLDTLAIQAGCKEEAFIETVGKKASSLISAKSVLLLVGKGNKGADCFATGVELLKRGVAARAITLYPEAECSEMNRLFHRRFTEKGGQVQRFKESIGDADLIVDGLLGTGFRGQVEGEMALLIALALQSHKPILAIDIPSGLDGTTGEVKGVAVVADETVALGAYKTGFFLRDGWNHVGKLHLVDFGIPPAIYKQAHTIARVPKDEFFAPLLPKPKRNRHKYDAGYVVGFSGSTLFRGAPKLAGLAALRSGAGIVRIFHRGDIGDAPMELITERFSMRAWKREILRARALFLGPGLGASKEVKRLIKHLPNVPVVVDADAIQEGISYPPNAVITPHRGEVLRLFGIAKDTQEEDLLARCQKWVQKTEVILVLKGAPTYIFTANEPPVIIPRGSPGMAKAGTGDVLTGMIAALLAQRLPPLQAAILGVSLHARAGEVASMSRTDYGVIASDLIEEISQAMATSY